MYVEHVVTHLWEDLDELRGHVLVCDCPPQVLCEGDESRFTDDRRRPSMATGGRSWRAALGSITRLPAALADFIPYVTQESIVAAFRGLFPWFSCGFLFPFVEDLVTSQQSTFHTLSKLA